MFHELLYVKRQKINPKTLDIEMCDVLINEEHESIKKRKAVEHTCDVCQKSFLQKSNLTSHVQSVHLRIKKHACYQCEMRFTYKSKLTRHENSAHFGMKNHACDQCDMIFATKHHLSGHVNGVHLGMKPHACHLCEMRFTQKGSLTRHVGAVHLGIKNHACNRCDMRFAEKVNLTFHVKTMHLGLKDHMCNQCKMRFTRKESLTVHVKTIHLGEKPHKCIECGKLFTQLQSLRRHVDSHEVAKSWMFVCTFAEGKIHTEDGSSDGILCGVRCRTQWILDYHVQASHTDEGLRSKYKSEAKLAAFLDSKGCHYDRDRVNHVSLMCKPELNLTGSRCFPDFFLLWLSAMLKANVILGNDENGHRRYPCDLRRTLEMATAISAASDNYGMKLLYVRFNPHFYTVDGVVRDRPLAALHEEMWKVLEGLTAESLIHNGLNLIYINYDQISAPATENKPTELWRRLQLFTHLDAHPDDENSEMALLLRDLVIGVY